jgi:hypothetical protein
VYDKVFTHLGGGHPLMSPEEEAIHITQIRTRGMDAQVDMTYPRTDGLYQLVTLTLEHSVMTKWHVKSFRRWALRDVEAPKPNYVAAPVQEKPAEPAATPTPEPQSSNAPAPEVREPEHQPSMIFVPETPPITLPPPVASPQPAPQDQPHEESLMPL